MEELLLPERGVGTGEPLGGRGSDLVTAGSWTSCSMLIVLLVRLLVRSERERGRKAPPSPRSLLYSTLTFG